MIPLWLMLLARGAGSYATHFTADIIDQSTDYVMPTHNYDVYANMITYPCC